jgi:hypothetical protein
MKLSKEQRLLLHNVLFHYTNTSDYVNCSVKQEVESLMDDLRSNILSDDREYHEEDKDDLTKTEDLPLLLKEEVLDLEELCYGYRGKNKLVLSFELNNDCLDAVSDDEVLECVSKIIRREGSIEIHTDEGLTSTYNINGFPHDWERLLELNVAYGIEVD